MSLLGERLEQEYYAEYADVQVDKVVPKKATKEDLLQIIKEKEADIASLHAEIDKLEKYKAFDEGTEATKIMHDSFIRAGFTEDQAFILTRDMINNVFKSSMINVKIGR